MFNPYDPRDLHVAERYENEIITDAREHPHIGENMLVRVFDEETGTEFMGYGIIVKNSMRWSEFFCQYVVDVRMRDTFLRQILAGRLEREVSSMGLIEGVVGGCNA